MRQESAFLKRAHNRLAEVIQKHLLEVIQELPPTMRARFELNHPGAILDLKSKKMTLDELDVYDVLDAMVVKK